MKNNKVSRTALGTAAGRAIESFRCANKRLFDDRFAYSLLPPFLRVIVKILNLPGIGSALLLKRERQLPGIMGNLLCRTRFIDDSLCDAIHKGLDQVVILGAGFDTRAYRIPGIEKTRVFEVDHPITQAWKQSRLKKMFGNLPPHVKFVPIDFDRQKLDEEMTMTDFRTGIKTFFIWEGVTQYITAEAVDSTLHYVSQAAVSESEIVFTYINRGVIDGSVCLEGSQRLISNLKRQGEPWIFGIDPTKIAQFLASRGFTFVEQVGASEYQKRYLNPLGRQMNVFEGELTVLAQIKETLQGST